MSGAMPSHAMVLAAGLGRRMRAANPGLPKPLIPCAGKPLIDYALDRLADFGVRSVVVNSHYLADLLTVHVTKYAARRPELSIRMSLEEVLMDTGGGVAQALPYLGREAFFVQNSDTVVQDGARALARLSAAWDDVRMDALLLLCPQARAFGHTGGGDFRFGADGRPQRAHGAPDAHIFCGLQMLHPRLFGGAPAGPYSLNHHYDKAAERGRLFAVEHDSWWHHVGTPEALVEAECRLKPETGE